MKKEVVVIGGGTGTYSVLLGLKRYQDLNLTALVAVTDDGGSSGKLRDEFGFLPAGDLRQCISALASEEGRDSLMRQLFSYRFQKGGNGLEGHSFGNLLITAMTDIIGNQEKAIKQVSEILKISGNVVPISTDDVEIVIEQENGTITVGESNIKDNKNKRDLSSKIKNIWHQPKAKATKSAIESIKKADYIIIGPGGLYTSLITNILVEGIREEILKSKAPLIFFMNLMTDSSQTYGFTAEDHLNVLEKYLGKSPEYVVINNKKLDENLQKKYEKEQDYPVEDDLDSKNGYKVIKTNLLNGSQEIKKEKDFGTKRSLIRHSSTGIASALDQIIKETK